MNLNENNNCINYVGTHSHNNNTIIQIVVLLFDQYNKQINEKDFIKTYFMNFIKQTDKYPNA